MVKSLHEPNFSYLIRRPKPLKVCIESLSREAKLA